jgi:hypothetical protein
MIWSFLVVDAIAESYPLNVADRVEQASHPQNAAQSPMTSAGGQRITRRPLVTWMDAARLLAVVFLATILFTDFADPSVTDEAPACAPPH